MSKPNLDQYFMDIAKTVATRATCDRAHVGCVLVRDKRILSTGYNGSVSGAKEYDDVGHLMVDGHCVRTIHAEVNAVITAARHGTSIAGATAYCTLEPCFNCTKVLLNAGICEIVFDRFYLKEEDCVTILSRPDWPITSSSQEINELINDVYPRFSTEKSPFRKI